MTLFILFAVLSVLGLVLLFISGADNEVLSVVSTMMFFFCGLIALGIFLGHQISPREFETDYMITNTNNVPVRVSYVQYQKWDPNTAESLVIMPGQIKMLHNVRQVSREPLKYDIDLNLAK